MSEADIRKYDPEDLELKAVMGGKFLDKSQKPQSEPVKAEIPKVSEYTQEEENVAEEGDTEFEAHFLSGLKTILSVLGFGCLALLIAFWHKSGLMHISIAEPAMCVCSALAGFSVGRFSRRWK